MKRGHLYTITPAGTSVKVLVISSDVVNATIRGATCIEVRGPGYATPSIIAVQITDPVDGIAVTDRFATFAAKFFDDGTDMGPIQAGEMEAVEIGLRAVFDL